MRSIRYQTVVGTLWNFSEQLLNKGFGILVTLILARYLTPDDYGLVAMMTVFLDLSSVLVEAGLNQALIRKLKVTSKDYSTAFYANLTISLFVYVSLFLTAPYISQFYKQSALIDLIRVAGLAVILNAFSLVQIAILNREMKFKLQLKVSMPASILSSIFTIYLAYKGFGVWALISQMLVSAFLKMIFYWRLKIWRPAYIFSYKSLRELFSFSGYLLISAIINVPYNNMYVIFISKYFSATMGGLYFFSDRIKEIVLSQLVNSIQNVTYPALAKMQEDNVHLKQGYRKLITVTTFLLFPVMIFIAAIASPMFSAFLPKKWFDAVQYVQLMCLVNILYPLHSINLNILKVKGRSDIVFYINVFKKIIGIAIFIYSIEYGIEGILIGQGVASIMAYIPNSFYSSRLIGYKVKEQFVDFVPGLILSALIGWIAFQLQLFLEWPDMVKFLILGFSSIIMYLSGAFILKLNSYKLLVEIIYFKKF